MERSISYKQGFIPYAMAALLIGLVGGFSTVLGPAFVQDIGIAYNNTTWTALAQAMSTAKYFEDKTIIVGHTPTSESNGGADRIFYGNGTIFIDCGLGRGGRLGCLRLEDGKEFYV